VFVWTRTPPESIESAHEECSRSPSILKDMGHPVQVVRSRDPTRRAPTVRLTGIDEPSVALGQMGLLGLESQNLLTWRLTAQCSTLIGPSIRRRFVTCVGKADAHKQPLDKVPSAHFDSDQFPPGAGLAAWRQMTASLYQTWPRGEPEGFRAQAAGYKVGELVFNQAEFTPARFLRGPELLVGEGRDFLSLQMQLAGEERLIMSDGHVRLLTGNLYLRDWAYAFDSEASAMRLNAIMIPRHRLRAGAGIQAHTPVLSWSIADPEGRLLAMLWQQLLAELGQVTLPHARTLCDAFLAFLDALLGYGPTQTTPASLGAMQQFLMTRLQGSVGVEALCRHFHVSRSKVYRLFEPLGGVRQFINGARLERCYGELRGADPRRVKIADIASSWGFVDASAFSRRFRSRFGVSPSEVLGTALDHTEDAAVRANSAGARLNRDYTDWLLQASGRET